MGCVRAQLQQTEQADSALCRVLETSGSMCFTDRHLLLIKATSAASLHCLLQCMNILQRSQQVNAKKHFTSDEEFN